MILLEEKILSLRKKLREQHFKLTPQREIILKVILDNIGKHLSAEEVYLLVKDVYPEIGLATVYRTLELFNEINILQKLNFGDGVVRFELKKENEDHLHHHLVCQSCGIVYEIEDDLLDPIEQKVKALFNFKVLDHRLIFYGLCEKCAELEK